MRVFGVIISVAWKILKRIRKIKQFIQKNIHKIYCGIDIMTVKKMRESARKDI